jgi:cyclophilin family peptidyl-prolyl cis-trans isomerase
MDQPRHPFVMPPPDYCTPFKAAGARYLHKGPAHPTGHPRWTHAPPMLVDPHRKYYVNLAITLPTPKRARHAAGGTVTMQLDPLHAPTTTNDFLFLACNGYYAGATFDRVIPGLLVEGGLPADAGTRGYQDGPGYPLATGPARGQYARGAVAMLDDGRFFILLDRLIVPPRYTVFGKVTAGMDSLTRLSNAPVTMQPDAQEPSLPLQPYRITSIGLAVTKPGR